MPDNFFAVNDIRHVSFDAWNTLLIPNLSFSGARTEFIADAYGVSFDEAKAVYTRTKKFLDRLADLSGMGLCTEKVYLMLDDGFKKTLDEAERVELMRLITNEFIKQPPAIADGIVDELSRLKDRGLTVGILSNTNFITGDILTRFVFNQYFGNNFFETMRFSDEHEVAKPHSDFYDLMVKDVHHKIAGYCRRQFDRIGEPAKVSDIEVRQRILHVGDNHITDIVGGIASNVLVLKVESPDDCVIQLKNYNC